MKLSRWERYTNGNYKVMINLDDGTKIRICEEDECHPTHPESIDVKITNKCEHNCAMCHENSSSRGEHADILNANFISTLLPYTELALGGGNPLEHPDLEAFLYKCKERKLIPNITVHQDDYIQQLNYIKWLYNEGLVYGVGVSINNVTHELIDALHEIPTTVCHLIAGVADERTINKLAHNDLKILILGYKILRRGAALYSKNASTIDFLIQYLYDLLPVMQEENWFKSISFDNLAIEQLHPERLVSEEEYAERFMGEDGTHTFYVDLVKKEFAQSSTSEKRHAYCDDVTKMFNVILEEHKNDC